MRRVIYQLILFLYTNNQDDVYALAARNILKNIHKIKDCSITDVAKLCFVSPATISRLCRKLSFDSFSDFKSAIVGPSIEHKNRYFPNYQTLKESNAAYQEILNQQVEAITNTIQATYQQINFETIIEVCKAIHDANKVIFIGNHTAQFTSIQFQEKLVYFGKDCYGSLNHTEQLNLVKNATKDDIIILGSLTGALALTNANLVRYFKRSPASKVVFSNHEQLLNSADYSVNIQGNNDSLISKYNLTYLFDLLEMIYTNIYNK